MVKKINKSGFSLFLLITYFGFQGINAMEIEPYVSEGGEGPSINSTIPVRASSLPLREILTNLNNTSISLEERIRLYNPTIILKQISEDLRSASKENLSNQEFVTNLLLKSIFAIHFHEFMVFEIPDEILPFFDTLKTVFSGKKRGKNPFSVLPNFVTGNQKHVLWEYLKRKSEDNPNLWRGDDEKKQEKIMIKRINDLYVESTLLKTFFPDNNDELLGKCLINKASASFRSEIIEKFNLKERLYVFGNHQPMIVNPSFLKHAFLFGSSPSVPILLMYAMDKAQNSNFGKVCKEDYLEALECFYMLEEMGNLHATLCLATLLMSDGKTDEAEARYKKCATANEDNPLAMHFLAEILHEKGNTQEAQKWLKQALSLGYNDGLLLSAKILESSKNFKDAEACYKKAIRFGVKDAEIYYARFLSLLDREQESLKYQEFHEGNVEQSQDSSSDEEESDEDKEKKFQLEMPIVTPVIQPIQTISTDESSLMITQTVAPDLPDANGEKDHAPKISKKLQRLIDRADKREKASKLQKAYSKNQAEIPKTYLDVKVSVLPKIHADVVGEHQIKIQNLISSLANGEARGRFETLKGNDACSMRLTNGDRFVFKITGGDTKNGITSLTILSIKGHYDNLESVVLKETKPVLVKWSPAEK